MRILSLPVLLLCAIAPIAAYSQASSGELLDNPGFDRDENNDGLPDGWNTSAKQSRRQEIQAFSGNFELVSQPGAYVLATQDVRLQRGEPYVLRMRVRGEGGAVAGALLLHGETKPTSEFPIVWNLEVSERYEDYLATFRAPNAACRLYIYNVSRQGVIYYDYVSLRPGEPNQLIVQQLSLPKIDRPVEPPPVTEHIPYARPLAGGPLRALIVLRSFRQLREAIELAQRIELDYDVLDVGYDGEQAVSETGRRIMQRLEAEAYDVYLVSARLGTAALQTIQKRVAKGAGLVIIEGFGQGERFLEKSLWAAAPKDHYLRRGLPWELLPGGLLEDIQLSQLGQGRVVRLLFPMDKSRVWGLLPCGLRYEAWKERRWAYWEGWLALLAKAMLWAARGEPASQLRVSSSPDVAREKNENAVRTIVTIKNPLPEARAEIIYRSARELRFDGPMLRLPPRTIKPDATGRFVLEAPRQLPAGAVIADVILRDNAGRVHDWLSYVLKVPQQAQIISLEAPHRTISPGQDVRLTATIGAPSPMAGILEGRLVDAYGRLVSLRRVPVSLRGGKRTFSQTLPLAQPLCVHHKAFVRLLVAGREQDSAWLAIRVPEMGPRLAAADFVATAWGPSGFPLASGLLTQRTRALGLNGEFATDPYLAGERGMLTAGYSGVGDIFREEPHSRDVRRQCLSDPAVIEKYTALVKETAAAQMPEGPYAVGITDEAFLSYHWARQELCFCPFCQARFRRWLQARYPSLKALNAQWGTNYKSWDEIRGAKTEEIRGQENFGRFVDFRLFMTDVWIEACRSVRQAYHEINPAVPVGHTNTFGVNPFNGNDYWKLATQTGFGWGQEYSEAIKSSANKAIFEIWRSFVETPEARASRQPRGRTNTPMLIASARTAKPTQAPGAVPRFFNHGWIGYDRREVAAHYEPWWLALHNSRGVSYFATSAYDTPRGRSWALVYPTGSLTEYSAAVRDALADLRGGVGKLLMEYERARPSIALLWSHPSMLVAWAESREEIPGDPPEYDWSDAYASWFMSAHNFRRCLQELQLDYEYVAPDQILSSNWLQHYRLLILPFTIAASPALVERLLAYVEQGGVILGDLRCLRTDEHGKPDNTGQLARLFGVERRGDIQYGESQIVFRSAAEGIELAGKTLRVFGQEQLALAGATALATHSSGAPAVCLQPHERGLTIYLNFKLPRDPEPLLLELLRQIITRAGIRRDVIVTPVEGGATFPRAWELNTFVRGPIVLYGFIRDFRSREDTDPVVIRFGRRAHTYDVRARRYLGAIEELRTSLPPGETALYAQLPYRVTGITLHAPKAVVRGTSLAVQIALQTTDVPGDHVIHFEAQDPQQKNVWAYRQNVLVIRGRGVIRLPFALNDPSGRWTLRARDVITGVEASVSLELRD